MTGWFTPEETHWLISSYLFEFINFDRARTVLVDGVEVSAMDEFLARVMNDFKDTFPYRYPGSDVSSYPAELQPLQVSSVDIWQGRWLRETGEIPDPSAGPGADGSDSTPPANANTDVTGGSAPESEEHLTEPHNDQSNATGTDHGRTKFSALPTDYAVPDSTLAEWGDMLTDLQQMATSSWAMCEPRELQSTATPRSTSYLQMDQSLEARMSFAQFTSEYIDNEQDGHPLPPADKGSLQHRQSNLSIFFSMKLRWQGGGTEVPYQLLEDDATEGRWQIVKKEVLPPGVQFVRDPMDMGEPELALWLRHLHAGWKGQLNEKEVFQFNQPRPGVHCDGYQWQRAPNAVMAYGPEALSYARLHLHPTISEPTPRLDRIPIIHTSKPPYESIPPDDVSVLSHVMGEDSPTIWLLRALQEHDRMHPYQASDEDWITMITEMPYLKLLPPEENAFIDHLDAENGYLPWAFYDASDPMHQEKNLTRTLAWCSPHRWRHGLTHTLIGGRCGVKWPVVILLFLAGNVRKVQRRPDAVIRHYGPGRAPYVVFEDREIRHIDTAIKLLERALRESIRHLAATMPYRLYGDLLVVEDRISEALHWRLKMGISAITWFEPVVHDDPWHDVDAGSATQLIDDAETPESAPFSMSSPVVLEGAGAVAPHIVQSPVSEGFSQAPTGATSRVNNQRRVRFSVGGAEISPGEASD
ncbi:hypothetical protein FRC11_006399 [Ceratobasidium sp. 423]|nr:hypothetical protein FRC11_006399 [Ceratobasidium sp. 423]